MPPKKPPSKLTAQGSTLNLPPTANNYRQPLPAPILPPSDSIPPLWRPNAVPTEVFPEWTDPTALPADHWGTAEQPFEDSLTPENLLLPKEVKELSDSIIAEQIETLQAWAKEEERIVLEQRHRERMYMGFEDAIAYIVNERPRDLLAEVDFDADDLVDDGQDEDDALTINMDVSNATSPWGVMPPPRIEIAPNAVYKPEIPHGDIIHANMASYFRIVEQLYSSRQDNNSNMAPFLWQAIYPQDNSGKPVYNPGGKYCVKLYVLGRWRRVDVDDKLPIDADGNVIYLSSSVKTLTSWKVSRWEPKASFGASENVFHQLLQPQAVICCAGVNQVADMVFGEVVLVTDVVGDTGNTTFKVVRQGSPATISEETNGVNELVFLLVHPVLQYSDTFIRGWLPNPEPVVEGVEEARAELVPFETPRVQFVVISRHDAAPDQSPGDSLSDTAVNLVASLTSVQPPEQELYNLNKSSAVISTHLGVDPSGSLILIEEMDKKASSTSSLPAILTLNSTYSEFIRVSPVDKGNIVYRVYPQKSLRYGYSIHVESSHKVAFQDAPTYWRSLSNLHVIECDGVHPVMLPVNNAPDEMTQYEGVYEPNKPLLCFRDVIMAPKTSIWTSFHFQLLRDGAVESALAAKLEVYDLGSNSARIGEKNFKGEVRLLQLPCVTTADGNPPSEDKRGYIIQGSIDRATCIVPDEVQSRRPCRSHSNRPLNDLTTTSVEGNSDVPPPGSARSSRAHCDIKWRLTCWSSEDVKLQEDNTKELQFEAIRASWAEKAVDRNTNGAVSRLLYLGKVHEAEVRMKQDNMMDEQIAKVKSRFEWIQAVKAKITSAGVNESYLEEAPGSDEKLLSEDELTESKRLLLERIGAVEADKEQRRVARALAKEKRAQELKNIVRAVIDRRASSLKKQQELKRQLAAALTQSA
ncbi:hypothetical protein PInf_012184 [Phytophthora infestans]|nr:hypothetical protein PInf_012184 [Phytophthora infestans]